ncbi:MAG: hypothetical protein JOZ41_10670, partial [Chloroflexi bacterium]|nr:hypothetical protein [Chloroflexota bacterium]
AQSVFGQALSEARDIPFPFGEARVWYEYGMMEARRGHRDEARNHLESALSLFQRLGARGEVERTERAIGDLGNEEGEGGHPPGDAPPPP